MEEDRQAFPRLVAQQVTAVLTHVYVIIADCEQAQADCVKLVTLLNKCYVKKGEEHHLSGSITPFSDIAQARHKVLMAHNAMPLHDGGHELLAIASTVCASHAC